MDRNKLTIKMTIVRKTVDWKGRIRRRLYNLRKLQDEERFLETLTMVAKKVGRAVQDQCQHEPPGQGPEIAASIVL
jgi:hypothetical protein